MDIQAQEKLGFKLVHAVTEYDRQQEARDIKAGRRVNIYALGIMLGAVNNVIEDINAGKTPRAAILANFNGRLCDRCLTAIGEPKFTMEEMRGQSIVRG